MRFMLFQVVIPASHLSSAVVLEPLGSSRWMTAASVKREWTSGTKISARFLQVDNDECLLLNLVESKYSGWQGS